MPNAFQTKADVLNEIRNNLYYNQLEVQRLLNNPNQVAHKSLVEQIVTLLKANVVANSAIDLLEAYLPTPPAPEKTQEVASDAELAGIKRVE